MMAPSEPAPARMFALPAVELTRRQDGTTLLCSGHSLERYGRCTGEYLVHWARRAPTRRWLAERAPDGSWRGITYGEALELVHRVGGWLLGQNLSAERPGEE